MGLSTPPPSWASIKNKPTTVAGFGISDLASNAVTSINGQVGAVTDTAAYAIGSFILGRPGNTTNYPVGSTIAGSSLYSCSMNGAYSTAYAWTWIIGNFSAQQALVNVGSWRCVSAAASDGSSTAVAGLWVRYA